MSEQLHQPTLDVLTHDVFPTARLVVDKFPLEADDVGEQTFGKGSVQQVFDYSGGRILKVTIAKWYTPKDKNINAQGITPDKVVTLTSDDANAGRDPQMDAAKQLAQ